MIWTLHTFFFFWAVNLQLLSGLHSLLFLGVVGFLFVFTVGEHGLPAHTAVASACLQLVWCLWSHFSSSSMITNVLTPFLSKPPLSRPSVDVSMLGRAGGGTVHVCYTVNVCYTSSNFQRVFYALHLLNSWQQVPGLGLGVPTFFYLDFSFLVIVFFSPLFYFFNLFCVKTLNLYSLRNLCTTDTELAAERLRTNLRTWSTLMFGYTKSECGPCAVIVQKKKKPSPYSVCKVVWPIPSECSWWKKLQKFWSPGRGCANITILCPEELNILFFFFCILWHLFFTEGDLQSIVVLKKSRTSSRCLDATCFFFPFRFLTLTFLTAVQFAFPCIDWVAVEAIYWSLVISTNV